MKISKLYLLHLRNDEHFQFHTDIIRLIYRHSPQALKIEKQFEEYLKLYKREDEGIKKINKSALTAKIQEADKARDKIWSSMVKINDAALNHFAPEVVQAAKRLKILFDTYGNIAKKPQKEQSAATHNILQELKGKYAADTATVGLEPWVKELAARNEAFGKLMRSRFEEKAAKSDINVKEARVLLDEAYRGIIERISALMLLEGGKEYEQFVRGLNVIVEHYAATLARRVKKK